MPGKSSAAASVLVDMGQQRLEPPPDLGKSETALFRDLVAACAPQHFRRSDLPLLARYCEAVILAETAARELREGGPVTNGRASPWLTVQEKAVRAVVALSMRLRLSPQSRLDPKSAARESVPGAQTAKPWDPAFTAKKTWDI